MIRFALRSPRHLPLSLPGSLARLLACALAATSLAACATTSPGPNRAARTAAAEASLPSARDERPEVVEAAPETAGDRELARRVEEALANDAELSERAKEAVTVRCRSGRVILRGGVQARDEKARVEADARDVAGGANVVSDLSIVGDGTGIARTASLP